VAPPAAAGSKGWLVVSMCQIASVSLRARIGADRTLDVDAACDRNARSAVVRTIVVPDEPLVAEATARHEAASRSRGARCAVWTGAAARVTSRDFTESRLWSDRRERPRGLAERALAVGRDDQPGMPGMLGRPWIRPVYPAKQSWAEEPAPAGQLTPSL
jgi:hypothetical protein